MAQSDGMVAVPERSNFLKIVRTARADSMTSENSASSHSKLEFDVDLTCGSCASKKAIQSTGKKAVLKGYGASSEARGSLAAAVSEISGPSGAVGVVRFSDAPKRGCIIDGTIDGLDSTMRHRLQIHELGDLSNGCDSTGVIFNPLSSEPSRQKDQRVYGALGEISVDSSGRSVFRKTDDTVRVPDIIGRSLVVCAQPTQSDTGCLRLACGIIARASGLFQNPKRICACSGATVWDEANSAGRPEQS
ncbi:copper chaperone for superoxide dismutase isoform X2 [Ixodes scapularis]|uniref:copper chaperone for superoxide dismutase isoform X2 n=1 Tax=Ixodes scapularis TaxID=6945 RepID=UPI001A9DCE56|nr:copper chaperone for superoxide dismutase isoform X2 [Ixodes scapularis]